MRHKIFIAFLSLLTATSTLDMAKAQSLPYKNKNLPIEERVEDLLNRMTVDEKIGTVQRFCNCEDGYSQPGFFYHVFLNEIHAFSAIVASEGKAFDKSP